MFCIMSVKLHKPKDERSKREIKGMWSYLGLLG